MSGITAPSPTLHRPASPQSRPISTAPKPTPAPAVPKAPTPIATPSTPHAGAREIPAVKPVKITDQDIRNASPVVSAPTAIGRTLHRAYKTYKSLATPGEHNQNLSPLQRHTQAASRALQSIPPRFHQEVSRLFDNPAEAEELGQHLEQHYGQQSEGPDPRGQQFADFMEGKTGPPKQAPTPPPTKQQAAQQTAKLPTAAPAVGLTPDHPLLKFSNELTPIRATLPSGEVVTGNTLKTADGKPLTSEQHSAVAQAHKIYGEHLAQQGNANNALMQQKLAETHEKLAARKLGNELDPNEPMSRLGDQKMTVRPSGGLPPIGSVVPLPGRPMTPDDHAAQARWHARVANKLRQPNPQASAEENERAAKSHIVAQNWHEQRAAGAQSQPAKFQPSPKTFERLKQAVASWNQGTRPEQKALHKDWLNSFRTKAAMHGLSDSDIMGLYNRAEQANQADAAKSAHTSQPSATQIPSANGAQAAPATSTVAQQPTQQNQPPTTAALAHDEKTNGQNQNATPVNTWTTADDRDVDVWKKDGGDMYSYGKKNQIRLDTVKNDILKALPTVSAGSRGHQEITALRERVPASRREFDDAIKQLQAEKQLHLIPAAPEHNYTDEELHRAIHGNGQTLAGVERGNAYQEPQATQPEQEPAAPKSLAAIKIADRDRFDKEYRQLKKEKDARWPLGFPRAKETDEFQELSKQLSDANQGWAAANKWINEHTDEAQENLSAAQKPLSVPQEQPSSLETTPKTPNEAIAPEDESTEIAKTAQIVPRGTSPQEPPVAPGHVRFYHGGLEGGQGQRWFSQDRKYAQGYADKSDGKVSYIDLPENHPLLEKSFNDEGTSMKAPYVNFEAPAEIANQRKVLQNEEPSSIASKIQSITNQQDEPSETSIPVSSSANPADSSPTQPTETNVADQPSQELADADLLLEGIGSKPLMQPQTSQQTGINQHLEPATVAQSKPLHEHEIQSFMDRNGAPEWLAGLTPEESAAVTRASGNSFGANKALRGDENSEGYTPAIDSDMIDRLKPLDAAIAKSPPLKEPVTVYRGLDMGPEQLQKFLEGTKSGSAHDRGYSSTSFSGKYIDKWNGGPRLVKLEIRLPVGTKGAFVEPLAAKGLAHEREYLLPRDANFKVASVKQMPDGSHHVVMDYAGTEMDQNPVSNTGVLDRMMKRIDANKKAGVIPEYGYRITSGWDMDNLKQMVKHLADKGLAPDVEPKTGGQAYDAINKAFAKYADEGPQQQSLALRPIPTDNPPAQETTGQRPGAMQPVESPTTSQVSKPRDAGKPKLSQEELNAKRAHNLAQWRDTQPFKFNKKDFVLQEIQKRGGINRDSAVANFGNDLVKRLEEDNPRIFRDTRNRSGTIILDDLIPELQRRGLLTVPEGRQPADYMMERLADASEGGLLSENGLKKHERNEQAKEYRARRDAAFVQYPEGVNDVEQSLAAAGLASHVGDRLIDEATRAGEDDAIDTIAGEIGARRENPRFDPQWGEADEVADDDGDANEAVPFQRHG
jgi:hypothetical protein